MTDRTADLAPSPHPASHSTGSLSRRAKADPSDRVAVDLWLVRHPAPNGTGRRLVVDELDAQERSRAASFQRPRDALLYTAAHIALRRLLAATLGLAPQDVAYVREACPGCGGPHGRPVLWPGPEARGHEPAVHFSLSHSSGRALVGVASAPIGVDIQRIPSARTTEICTSLLHPGERTELESLPQSRRGAAFGQLWARKEAYLKGLGTGLERPLYADYLGTGGRTAWLRPPHWTVLDLPSGPAHTAAVAVLGTPAGPCTVRPLPAEWLYEDEDAGGGEDDAVRVLARIARLTAVAHLKETLT
jgi:4'-phosphopantetheinyl transferase